MSSLRVISPTASRSRRTDLPARLLSAREVAHYVGVTERTVRRWQAEGRLVPIRLSTGTVRFTRAALDALIGPVDETRPTGQPGVSKQIEGNRGADDAP